MEYPIIETAGNWHKIDVSGRIGYIYKPATRYVFNHTDKYFKVTEEELPVYDNRTGTLVEVGKLKKDQVFQRISDAGNWHKIQYGSIDGYVRENSTDVAGKTAVASNPVISSKDNFMALQDLPVYDNSTGKLIPFATIPKDQIYPFIGESGNWMEVQMAGRKGFVYRSGVRKGPTINYMNYNRSLNEVVQLQMTKNPQTDKDYRTYVRADALKVDNEETPTKGIALGAEWNVRGGAGDQHWVLGRLKDQEEVDILGKVSNKEDGYDWYEIKYNRTWVNASPYDIGYYVNPDKFPSATKGYYQFLKLSGSAQISAKEVNDKILKGKGILAGKGDAFIKAGLTNKINEVYLISHALLETGNGKSTLASGVKVKQKRDSNGDLVYVNVAGEKLVDIEILNSSATDYDAIVYNMFGIQAFDSNPNLGGARKALHEGWTTPEKAIIGGGNIIAQNYIYQGQDTLYKMRWNPDRPGTHQYATDVAWAFKQTTRMFDLYRMIDHYYQVFEIPKYK